MIEADNKKTPPDLNKRSLTSEMFCKITTKSHFKHTVIFSAPAQLTGKT